MAYVPAPTEKTREMVIRGFMALHAVKARTPGSSLSYTTRELAYYSGVSTSTLYNHFRDVDYLSEAALTKRTAMLSILLNEVLDGGLSTREGIKSILFEYGRDICLYYQTAVLRGVKVGLAENTYNKLNSKYPVLRSSLLGAMYAAAGGASREVFDYLYDVGYTEKVGP